MLIRALGFVLETVFFLLIAAVLLRAWMNWLRINMSGQPGSVVMALTDWIVKPLRRVLPKAMVQSRVDWASVVAACVFAIGYATVWGLLFGMLTSLSQGWTLPSPAILVQLPVFAGKMLLRVALQGLFVMVLGYALLSWVQPAAPAYQLLGRLVEPLLLPLRRFIPTIGGVDLSALVLLVLLQVGMIVLV